MPSHANPRQAKPAPHYMKPSISLELSYVLFKGTLILEQLIEEYLLKLQLPSQYSYGTWFGLAQNLAWLASLSLVIWGFVNFLT